MIETNRRQVEQDLTGILCGMPKEEIKEEPKVMKEKKKRFKDDAPCNLPVWYKKPERYSEPACFKLAAAIIESNNNDYIKVLKKIMKFRKESISNPTISFMLKGLMEEKEYLESFYQSKTFENLSMGYVSGEEAIKILKVRAHYEDDCQ